MTALLEARGVVRRFGGVVALDHFDLSIAANDIVGLIGPNGSGKTTFFNVVTGIYRANSGRIVFAGADITATAARLVYRLGISRTFQRSRLSLPLSIFDNIMIGNHKRLNQGLWFNLVRRRDFRREFEASYAAARALLELFEPTLVKRMFEPVAGLAMIDRRRIEICRALISAPRLLLLDEPSAGLDPTAARQLFSLLRSLHADLGLTILMVEHHVPAVLENCDLVYVLSRGRVATAGSSEAVLAHPDVRDQYLGAAFEFPVGVTGDPPC